MYNILNVKVINMAANQENLSSLTNYLLLGMQDDDNIYSQAVIYVCDHSQEGAIGLMISKEIDLTMLDLFRKLDLDLSSTNKKKLKQTYEKSILFGGSNDAERGFVLHTNSELANYSSSIIRDLTLTTSLDVLQDIADGDGPDEFIMTLGAVNWNANELEKELK